MLVSGELDDLPEQAFLYVGGIDEAIEKGREDAGGGLRWPNACASMS